MEVVLIPIGYLSKAEECLPKAPLCTPRTKISRPLTMGTTPEIIFRNLLLFGIALWIGKFLKANPVLLGHGSIDSDLPTGDVFPVYTDHPVLDPVLKRHEQELGDDYTAYRNHCLRVMSFARHHLVQPDDRTVALLAYAAAYHDLALWTDATLDYIEPSVAVMKRDRAAIGIDSEDYFPMTAEELSAVSEMIRQHHKVTTWQGPNEELVNAFRRGDWTDASYGVVRHGLPPSYVQAAYIVVPEAGFHRCLMRLPSRLSTSIMGRLDILKIFKL